MTRSDLQQLSHLRLEEAQMLLAAGSYSGAYYLAGYAVECALKACIAKETLPFEFPDKQRANEAYTHKLSDLIKAARLQRELDDALRNATQFSVRWRIVQAWSESSRYAVWSESDASALLEAIGGKDGVLQWAQRYW